MDYGVKKHTVVFLLFAGDHVFFKMAGDWGACGSEEQRQTFPLRAGAVLCGAGDSEQVLHGDAARGARLVLVVDRWPVALA